MCDLSIELYYRPNRLNLVYFLLQKKRDNENEWAVVDDSFVCTIHSHSVVLSMHHSLGDEWFRAHFRSYFLTIVIQSMALFAQFLLFIFAFIKPVSVRIRNFSFTKYTSTKFCVFWRCQFMITSINDVVLICTTGGAVHAI